MFERLPFFSPQPVIECADIRLRPLGNGDYTEWAALRAASRAFLVPWEPTWAADALERTAFRRRVRRYAEDARLGTGHNFLIWRREDGRLLGGISLTQIRYGIAWCGTLGYWMGQAYAGRGYMKRAVMLVRDWAFDELRLHRLEAACLPRNAASRRVLESAGMRNEGIARAYLCINGRWEDHLLYAIVAGDQRGPVSARFDAFLE